MNQRSLGWLGCWLLVACCAVGCGGDDDGAGALAEANASNIQRLTNLYFTFQANNDFRGPKDEAEFKAFLTGYNPEKLKRIGIDPATIAALFVSERDNQPFKIRYGVRGSAMGSTEPVVFEATGVDGKRQVGFLSFTQREVDPAEYDALWAGKGQPAAPQREG
jgi:hypothetical protein